jgi:hypothetical protein
MRRALHEEAPIDANPSTEPARAPTPAATARLTVRRQAPADVKMRQLVVSLDGTKVATLLFGDTFSTDLAPGEHRLRIHNTLVWKTVRFTAAAGEHVQFTAVNRPGPGTYSMLGLLGAGPLYVTITREP